MNKHIKYILLILFLVFVNCNYNNKLTKEVSHSSVEMTNWIFVPGGEITTYELKNDPELDQVAFEINSEPRLFRVHSFYILDHLVNNTEYYKFIQSGGYQNVYSFNGNLSLERRFLNINNNITTGIYSSTRYTNCPENWHLNNSPPWPSYLKEDSPVSWICYPEARAYAEYNNSQLIHEIELKYLKSIIKTNNYLRTNLCDVFRHIETNDNDSYFKHDMSFSGYFIWCRNKTFAYNAPQVVLMGRYAIDYADPFTKINMRLYDYELSRIEGYSFVCTKNGYVEAFINDHWISAEVE